jgi:hypothetical protein
MSKANKDNFAQPIYEDYRKTGDIGFLPPAVKPEINKIKLNTEYATKLQVLVGQARKEAIAPYINNMATLNESIYKGKKYSELDMDDKKEALRIVYDLGTKAGEQRFEELYPQFKEKNKNESLEEQKKDENEELGEKLRGRLRIKEKE